MTAAAAGAVYASVWLALICFVAGEAGKRRGRRPHAPWAWPVWTAGAILLGLHILLAMAVQHRWSHDAAVEETARQTRELYGVAWGGGLYLNYLFLGLWAGEAAWWRMDPGSYSRRHPVIAWGLRAFYFTILINAAVIFAAPSRQLAGAALVALLLWSWRPLPAGAATGEQAAPSSSRPL